MRGHAIEARVCAEDPDRDFLPSAGDLRLLEWPAAESIRVDAGFATGDVVPATYDSLLGKVIAWAPDRPQAAARLSSALEHIYCAGVQTNERWLARVLRAPRFLEVRHSIAFLQESAKDFAGPADVDAPVVALAAIAAHGCCCCRRFWRRAFRHRHFRAGCQSVGHPRWLHAEPTRSRRLPPLMARS